MVINFFFCCIRLRCGDDRCGVVVMRCAWCDDDDDDGGGGGGGCASVD